MDSYLILHMSLFVPMPIMIKMRIFRAAYKTEIPLHSLCTVLHAEKRARCPDWTHKVAWFTWQRRSGRSDILQSSVLEIVFCGLKEQKGSKSQMLFSAQEVWEGKVSHLPLGCTMTMEMDTTICLVVLQVPQKEIEYRHPF